MTIMLYRVHGQGSFGDHVIAKSKLNQFERVGLEYQSASGPGFSARKRGDAREVWLEEEKGGKRTPGWQVVTSLWMSDEERIGVRTDAKIRRVGEPSNWGPWIYIGRGMFMMFSVPPQLRLIQQDYKSEYYDGTEMDIARVWAYAQKPGYLSVVRVKPWQERPSQKRLLLPVMEGLEKFIGYGGELVSYATDFPGFGRSRSGMIETAGLQYPDGFAGVHDIDDIEHYSIAAINSKIVGTGGFGIPTAHATLDIVSFTNDFALDEVKTREVPIPEGIGGTGQHLCASRPITISPGVVCVISCEIFEPRQYYDAKMQGDFYLSIYDIGKSEWVVSAKKIVPEVANKERDYPYPRYQIRGRDEDGKTVMNVPYGDTTKKLFYKSVYGSYRTHDDFGYAYVDGVESGAGQPCCNSDNVLFAFVRFRGERATTGYLMTRSTDILVMKINRQGTARITNLFFPHTHDQRVGLNPDEYTGMYSSESAQYLNIICIGKGKFLLHINRFSSRAGYADSDVMSPPAEFFNYTKFLISEDDGDTWQEIEISGIPFRFSSGPSTAELGKPSIIKPLSAAAYQAGEYAEIVIPFFLDAGGGTEYYVSRDGGRSWELQRELSEINAMDYGEYDLFNGGTYKRHFSDRTPGIRIDDVESGVRYRYRDYYVRQNDLPTSEEMHVLETPESISGGRLQRVFIGHDPAPMDLVRPWVYDHFFTDNLEG